MSMNFVGAVFPPPVMREAREKHGQWLSLFEGRGIGPVSFGDAVTWTRSTTATRGRLASLFGGNGSRGEVVEEAATVNPTRHRPSARKVAMASSQAVFSQLPVVRSSHQATQEVLDRLQEGEFWNEVQGAEVEASALGGVYLTTRWNEAFSDVVGISVVPAHFAEPVFVNGYLTEVAFITRLSERTPGEPVVHRLVESHEVLDDGRGVVRYALYQGGFDRFGEIVPLTEHPEAAAHSAMIDPELGDGYFTGLVNRLDVVYVKNAKSGLEWSGPARWLGVSDFAGAEETMAELDWWVSERASEARRARTRLHVPEAYAEPNGPGKGLSQDIDRTVYTLLSCNPTLSGDSGAPAMVTATSTPLRNEQYQIAIDDAWRSISAVTGFSLNSLGAVQEATSVATATGVRALRDETAKTADMKQRAWRSALRELFMVMAAQQALIFGGSVKPESIEVEFADTENVDMTELSATVSTLLGAGAISLLTAVRMLHPAWDEEQVQEEVEAIEGVKSEPVVNPLMSNPLGVSLSSDIESSSSAQSIEENTDE